MVFNALEQKSPFLKKYIRKLRFARNQGRYRRVAGLPVDDKLIMFSSFMGKKYGDSPRAIYEYMRTRPEFDDYRFVWAFRYPDNFRFLEQNPRTSVLKTNSDEHYKVYATAKYWVVNSRVPDIIGKKDDQVYLQCWHGTPLKRLGFDIEVKGQNAKYTVNELTSKYAIDGKKYTYMTSPSAFCTEKFISAFGLDRIGRENIVIEEGYPRNDFLSNYTEEDVARIKEQLGLPTDKKLILYAPTWRDNQYNAVDGYTLKEDMDFNLMREKLGDEYVILYRAHYFVANNFDFSKYEGFVYNVCDHDEINDLYVVADMLITDYSSVFFDYAILKRPIIFYMYDLEFYRDEVRGFYISFDELPGPVVQTEDELIGAIEGMKEWTPDEKYRKFNDKYNYLDDGKASERVVERVFR